MCRRRRSRRRKRVTPLFARDTDRWQTFIILFSSKSNNKHMHGYHSVKVRVCNDSPKVACGQSKIKSALTFFPFSGHQNQHVHFLKLDGTTQTCLSRFHGSSSVLVLYFFHTVMVHIWLQHHPLVNQIVRTNTDLIK